MDLSTVHEGIEKRWPKTRVGRGIGSGHGKTSSRGYKGQGSRAGTRSYSPLYSGGQTPLIRRIPKRGFSNATWQKKFVVVNVGDLDKAFAAGAAVNYASLKEKGLANGNYYGVRVLSVGNLTKALNFTVDHVSAEAKKKIEAAGGKIELIAPVKKPVRNKMKPSKPKKAKR